MSEFVDNPTTRRVMNLASGVAFAGLGLFLIVASQQFEDAGRSTPMFIGYGLMALAVLLIVTEIAKSELLPMPESEGGSGRRRLVFVALMAVWILTLPYLGFLFGCSVMFILVAMAVPRSTPWTLRSIAMHALSGIITTIGFWFALTHLLSVPLPVPSIF